MVMTASAMLELGTAFPDFHLKDTRGELVSTTSFKGQPILLVFMCNHCPFVQHIREGFVKLAKEYQDRGVAVLGINSNINPEYPEDSLKKMVEYAQKYSYPFPYLIDDDQCVARAFHAACTPDFFLFDQGHKLVYRGQMDDSRPGNDVPVTGNDLRKALDSVLRGDSVAGNQKPSLGCNIKWCPGNEPEYFSD